MKKYDVTFYYHTSVTVTVEAENEKEAIRIGREEICDDKKYEEILLDNLDADDAPDAYEIE